MDADQRTVDSLRGKTALVSGGSGGIGSAIIAELQEQGAVALSLDRTPPAQGEAGWLEADVRDDASVRGAIDRMIAQHGRIDLLVHAAGVTRDAVLWKLTPEDWDLVQSVNLRGAFLLMRHAVPIMRQAQSGRIVLIGSINGSRGKFGLTAYSASKAGLLGLAKSAAQETARFGILVNVVEPGMVRTPMTDSLKPEVLEQANKEILLGRMAEPTDVAAAVAFLCGPGARHITGQVLRVDGGQYL